MRLVLGVAYDTRQWVGQKDLSILMCEEEFINNALLATEAHKQKILM